RDTDRRSTARSRQDLHPRALGGKPSYHRSRAAINLGRAGATEPGRPGAIRLSRLIRLEASTLAGVVAAATGLPAAARGRNHDKRSPLSSVVVGDARVTGAGGI